MAAVSDFLENAVLNQVFRATPMAPIPTVYVALYTSATTDAGGGTQVTGGGYVRQSVTFGAPSNGQISNSADVIFPTATASWGTVTHVAICDAVTAGNFLYHGALVAAKAIASGDTFKFNTGDLTLTLA